MDYNSKKQGQKEYQNQGLLQDQNFSIGTFMMCMSCAQSLYINSLGLNAYYAQKKFKHYDKADYSKKNIFELREQMATQLFLLKNSIMIFQQEHRKMKWEMPHDFNEQMFKAEIQKYGEHFNNQNDQQSQSLMQCFWQIVIDRKMSDLIIDRTSFAVKYTPQQLKEFQDNTLKGAMGASNQMQEERLRFQKEGVQNVKDIRTKVGQSGYYGKEKDYYKNQPYQDPHKKGKLQQKSSWWPSYK